MQGQLIFSFCLVTPTGGQSGTPKLKPLAEIQVGRETCSGGCSLSLALLYGKYLERFAEGSNELELYLKVVGDIPNKD